MAWPKGKPRPKGSGRKAGTPNKATADVRAAIAAFASANVDRMGQWLAAVEAEDPAKALDLYLKAIEYHLPKMQRVEKTIAEASDDEILAEVRRRRKAEAEKASEEGE